jgi:hypothetical protein
MSRTYALLADALRIMDLAKLTYSYFTRDTFSPYRLAKSGEWEIVADLPNRDAKEAMVGACRGGYIELVQYLIERYETSLSYHSVTVSDWGDCMADACRGGHIELVELMIAKGADCWNDGLRNACYGSRGIRLHKTQTAYKRIMCLMADNGASICNYCGGRPIAHIQS